MKIIEEKNNEVLGRKEIKILVKAEKNPSLIEAAEIVSNQFKADKKLVAIKKIQGKFGRDTFLIEAYLYASIQDKEKIEPKSKKEGGEKPAEQGEEKKTAEKPAEQRKQEATEQSKENKEKSDIGNKPGSRQDGNKEGKQEGKE